MTYSFERGLELRRNSACGQARNALKHPFAFYRENFHPMLAATEIANLYIEKKYVDYLKITAKETQDGSPLVSAMAAKAALVWYYRNGG